MHFVPMKNAISSSIKHHLKCGTALVVLYKKFNLNKNPLHKNMS